MISSVIYIFLSVGMLQVIRYPATTVDGTPAAASQHRRPASPICSYKADRGTCTANYKRFAYNCATNRCTAFNYGGCGGNGNRFPNKGSCESACVRGNGYCKQTEIPMPRHKKGTDINGRKFLIARALSHGRHHASQAEEEDTTHHHKNSDKINPACSYPVDPGMCIGNFSRYAYSCERNKCSHFIFGGCGGNSNRYLTKESCEKACKSNSVHCFTTTLPVARKDDVRWKRRGSEGRTFDDEEDSESNEEKSASTSIAASDEISASESSSSSESTEEVVEKNTEKSTKKKDKRRSRKKHRNEHERTSKDKKKHDDHQRKRGRGISGEVVVEAVTETGNSESTTPRNL